LDFNLISSFKGTVPLPALRKISYRSTPLANRPHHFLMCLIVFGSHVKAINDIPVPARIRDQADALRDSTVEKLRAGLLITSIIPLKFLSSDVPAPPKSGPSLARTCRDFLCGKVEIERSRIAAFRSKLSGLRERYTRGEAIQIADFEPPAGVFDSDGSFQGRPLRKVILPKKMIFRDGFSDGNDDDEQPKRRRVDWTSEYAVSASGNDSDSSS
jgi:hypothetical protein